MEYYQLYLKKLLNSTTVLNFDCENQHYHLLIILLLSGQFETNSGPVSFPCGICKNEVTENSHALLCDECNMWCHIDCCGISSKNYQNMCNITGSFSWICYKCGCPNFDSSLFGTRSIEISNPFSTLDTTTYFEQHQLPQTSTPTHASSQQRFVPAPPKNKNHKLKAMIINCNSLKSAAKQAAFRSEVEHHNPDIILGCESKINVEMQTYSLFPEDYTVLRKDRNEYGGGVFIAIRDTLISINMPELEVDCELLWTCLQFVGSKPLYITCFYGPQNNKSKVVDDLTESLSKLLNKNGKKYPNVVIGGDFNFPDINWESWSATNIKTASAHNKFLNFLLENSLSQLQTKIPRPISNSVLDLIATTCPQLITNIEVVPGISDHNIVLFDINLKPKTQSKPPHKVYNFKRANIELLKDKTRQFCQEFMDCNPQNNSVNANWTTIRDKLQ